MTIWNFAAAARRAWHAVLLGMVATAALLHQARTPDVVYSAVVTVTLVSHQAPSDLTRPQDGLVITAGLLSQLISDGLPSRTTSDTVTLVGEGVRYGYSVTVPSNGNQWMRRNERPELRVQAVGGTDGEVREDLARALRRVDQALAALQAPYDVAPPDLIRPESAATVPVVLPNYGSRTRASVAALLLGMSITVGSVSLSDKVLARWRLASRRGSGLSRGGRLVPAP